MFDPSELNLNLDENEEVNNKNKKDEVKAEKSDNTSEIIESEKETVEIKENTVNSSNEEKITQENSETPKSISETLEKNSVINEFKKPSEEKESTEKSSVEIAKDKTEENSEEVVKEKNIENDETKIEIPTSPVNSEETKELGKTEYEKKIAKEVEEKKKEEEKNPKKKEEMVFDINLNSLEILLSILIDKGFDFATFEPTDNSVKVNFRKNKVVQDTKYIKYPVYSKILLKAKALTNLTIEETETEQEGTGETRVRNKMYKVSTKVVPSDLGSKLFIKANEIKKKVVGGPKKKVSLAQIFTFFGAVSFITLVIGGAFIGFVVMNAKTVQDVQFFYSIGINLNDVNFFLGQALAFIFSVLIFIETVFLVIYLFKFFLTKKEFKKKKIRFGIIATFILFVAFGTGSAWMIIDKKIRELPNWQEMAYGDVQIYDNSKLLSESFNKGGALLEDTSNLIGPMDIKFDLSFYAKSEEQQGLTIKKYMWDFGDGEIFETPLPTVIHSFREEGNHEVSLNIQQLDLYGKITEKEVENIPDINIAYAVIVNEKMLNNGGKLVDFDATSVGQLGKIEWYFMENLNEPVWTGDIFRVGKPIFEETIIGMYIRNNDKESDELDKLFIVNGEAETSLDGEIQYERGIVNDLEFEFWLENLQNDFGNGYIEEYKWFIGDKEITREGDVENPVDASKITFKFDGYGEQDVKVIIKDSAGETKELSTTIEIPKKLNLSKPLKIYNEGVLMENVKYESKLNDYYIDQIGIPTNLKLDARFLRSNNLLYTLKKVERDYDSNGDIDETTKSGEYKISIEGNHTITVHYEFANRKIPDDIIKVEEKIFIEGVKKEAIIDFDIIKNSDYVPVTVSFDASTSQVKDDNIEKFIWDYGDGIKEEKDSLVQGHKYTEAGDYDIKLKVITTSGKEYSYSKKLILKPKPQSVKINTSMKTAPVRQGIDFSSEESEGQIVGYFWNFGDGNTSTEANPTHFYKKPGEYEVRLRLDFSNKNVLEDIIAIKIYEED